MKEKNCSLYIHVKPNGEVFYVGIGSKNRPFSKLNRNKFWHNIVNKYGYEIIILKSDLNWDNACELEKILINYYGRKDLKTGSLVNMTDGGEGTLNKSKETKSKISEAQKGSKNHMFGKTGKLNPNFNNTWTEEQKLKQSKRMKNYYKYNVCKNKGLIRSEETKRKISENANKPSGKNHHFTKIILDLETGIFYFGNKEASNIYNINVNTLRAKLNGSSVNNTNLRYV